MLFLYFYVRSASRAVRFGYLCLLVALCWAMFGPSASDAQRTTLSTVPDDEIFIVYRDAEGRFACRAANKAERDRINQRPGGGPANLIYKGAPRDGKTTTLKSLSGSTVSLLPSAGLRIVLNGTTQLNQNEQARNAFIVAANRWEAVIATPITVVIDVDYGLTFFGQPYDDPDILGATASSSFNGSYSDLRQRLIDTASTNSETELYNALPASSVPIELNGSTSSVTNFRLTKANARALAFVGAIPNPDSLPLGQGDAGIGFNSAFPFDFNPDDGIGSTLTDFDSVATHEIGHALGFVSNSGAGAGSSAVTVWDLFRFRAGSVTLATFATTPRVMSIGGSQLYFSNQLSTFATFELPLSTGGSNPGPGTGDGRQSSHWRDDSLESTRQYVGIMDPTLDDGLRRTFSENDLKAIDLFGYSLGGPPIVRPPNDNFADAINLSGSAGTTTGTNANATREVGERFHASFFSDKSIWYAWQSTVNGTATFDTVGSNFDTTLAIYTGTSVDQVINLAQNDDINPGVNRASRVQFPVTAGTTY